MVRELDRIPHLPGVYIIKDRFSKIIYIGKAKDLRKRIRTYFLKNADGNLKVRNIKLFAFKIDFIICDSEREALIIERRLISLYKPIFNVMWKDSKSYPYVVITHEDFPRLIITRKQNIQGRYFGPYPHSDMVKKLIEKLRDIGFVRIRRCNYNFSLKKPLDENRRNRCIYYHTMQCPAPCDFSRITISEYKRHVRTAKDFFSMKHSSLIKDFEKMMKKHSEKLEFERAREYRDFIKAINHIYERVSVNETRLEDVEKKSELTSLLISIKENLKLKNIPYHIESFDVSNIMNKYIVGASVCFINGVKNHSHYRRFKSRFKPLKIGGNDYAVIYEIVKRRYDDEKDCPDLVLIDGGKGQLEMAVKALRELGIKKTDVISIAKSEEIIFSQNLKQPIRLPKDCKQLLFIMKIRDETHRFAISYHRKLRESHFIL
ncbi:MAG: GIY-YIG nuclease family protein [Elusimicrobiales bacterium]